MRVLVIDDDLDNLNELETAIRSFKAPDGRFYDTVGFSDYREALKVINIEPFDIVITDMVMGESMDEGIDVLKKLANRSAITIVITAYPSIPNCVEAMKAGAWDYIEKAPADGADPYERLSESLTKAYEYRLRNPQRAVTSPDSEWVHEHLDELIRKYPGKLVAVLYERVVDSDTSFAELSKRIQSIFPLAKPTIVSIPDDSQEVI